MLAPLLFYLPEPVGWIALMPDALREAQLRARESIGTGDSGERPAKVPTGGKCVSAEEAARALGVAPSWLMRQARMRKIPFVKAGRYCRFDVDALRAHLARPTK